MRATSGHWLVNQRPVVMKSKTAARVRPVWTNTAWFSRVFQIISLNCIFIETGKLSINDIYVSEWSRPHSINFRANMRDPEKFLCSDSYDVIWSWSHCDSVIKWKLLKFGFCMISLPTCQYEARDCIYSHFLSYFKFWSYES